MKVIKIFKETISDGFGFRYSIYFSGCNHHCEGCHNQETWKGDIGRILDKEYMDEIVGDINSNYMLDGITLSGGDPFFNPVELLEFLKEIKARTHKNIWSYTGYTYEILLEDSTMKKCLDYIDVLVDGKFQKADYHPDLYFRGSSNQRLIDVKKSLKNNQIITLEF
ncbi:MAG: anaerobic ribonucleoside-triphosphate reductase activating protein [Fusobacteriia bacterium 4572_74]|nr:MAG: anaerobic ribonucleoside-triphosphate reductase activating protein [Fusobacteriia bacterium 4572_74]